MPSSAMNRPSPRILEKQPDIELYGRPKLEVDTQRAEFQGNVAILSQDNTLNPAGTLKNFLVTAALGLAVFLMAVDQTGIGPLLPKISDEFKALDDLAWYGSAYLLNYCAFQLVFGKLYTLFSLKWIFILALSIFEIGTLLCAIAPTSRFLICGRAIAGLGCAGLYSGAVAIISYCVDLNKRSVYTGILGAIYGIACVVGPLLGGSLTDSKLTWRWLFWLNLPFGAIGLFTVVFFLRTPKLQSNEELTALEVIAKFDFFGTVCLISAVFSLLLALHWAGAKYTWQDKHVIALLVLSSVLIIVFLVIQYFKGEDATLPFRIVTERSVGSAALVALCTGGVFFLLTFYLPIWFQAVQGVDATQSGIRSLPFLLAFLFTGFVVAAGVTTWGYYAPFMILSSIFISVGAGLLTSLTTNTPPGKWIGYLIIIGAGLGFGFQQPLTAIKTVLDIEDIATATSMIVLFQGLGGSVFIMLAKNIMHDDLFDGLKTAIPGFTQSVAAHTGLTSLKDLFLPVYSEVIVEVLNDAIAKTFAIPTSLGIISFVGSLAIEWRSVRRRAW